jgi:serine/threonine-protein kinase
MPIDRVDALLETLQDSHLLTPAQLEECRGAQASFPDTRSLARHLLQRDWLTAYQVNQVMQGKASELSLGNYVLLERVGQGGMGQVFKARHRVMNRVVALKIIRQERLSNPDLINRFRREIQLAAQLHHPNIVIAYDADEVNGTHFLVMEFVEGTDLARHVEKNGRLPLAQACDYVRQAALGLQHAHERGMVHRDIKPANLLLASRENAVKVLDMGLARLSQGADAALTAAGLTQEGTVMGTPDYMAPEQAEESTGVDTRADVYSLGCSLYFLLAGRVPFPGGTLAQKLRKHAQAEPAPLSAACDDVPAGLAAVVRKMMAKRPAERYQTPGELAAALELFCRPGPAVAIPVAVAAAASRPVAVPLSEESLAALAQRATVAVAPVPAGETIPPSVLDSVASVTLRKRPGPVARVRDAWNRLGRRGQLITAGAAALALLLVIVIAVARRKPVDSDSGRGNETVLGRLADDQIPPEDQLDWHKEFKGTLVAVLGEHRVRVANFGGMAVHPKRTLVAVADGSVIRLVNTRTLRQEHELKGHSSTVSALAFSADGSLLASGAHDRSVRLWIADTGQPLPELPGTHDSTVRAVALTADGKRVLSAGDDGKVRVWNTTTREQVAMFEGHTTPVQALAVSADGKLAFSAGGTNEAGKTADRDVRVWEVETGNPAMAGGGPRLLSGHDPAFVRRLELSADRRRLLAGTNRSQVYIWELDGKPNRPLALAADDGNGPSDGTFVGEDQVATCDMTHGYLKLWVPNSRASLQNFDPIAAQPSSPAVIWLPAVPRENRDGAETDSGVLFHEGNTLRVWNLERKKEWRPAIGHSEAVRRVAFTEDGQRLISLGQDRRVCDWDLADLYDGATHWPRVGRPSLSIPLAGRVGFIGTASRDGNFALAAFTGLSDVSVWEWGSNTWTLVRTLEPKANQGDNVTALAASADGAQALIALSDKSLCLMDVKHKAARQALDGLVSPCTDVGFLPGGRGYCWNGNDLRLWEGLGDGEKPKYVTAPGVSGWVLVVSPEREVAFTGSRDGHIYRWTDLGTGKPVRTDLDWWQKDGITALALSPDRKTLLAASGDERLGVWDLTKDPIPRPQTYDLRGAPTALAFAPDGRHVAVGNPDGTIYILRLPLKAGGRD